jgi:hypothetical protein
MKIQQRKALVKIALLAFGWPLALNHFCDRNLAGGIGAFLLTWLAWISIVGLVFWVPIFFGAVFKELRDFEGYYD